MTTGRKTLKAVKADITDVIDPNLDQPKIEGAMTQMRTDATELALASAQHDSAVRAVATQLGYQLPADCTDPDLIQRDISMNMRRSVEACLEVGRGLAVLKAACAHGQFMSRLDVLGIDDGVARKFIRAASKFTNRSLTTDLVRAIGSQTKLFEMLILDDDQIEELELTGQTGELKLDDVATMSVKELRAALREERAEATAKNKVMADLNAAKTKLSTQLARIQTMPADEVLDALMKEATSITRDALGAVRGNLRAALTALKNHDGDANSLFMAGLVGQVQADINALRDEFNLPDVSTAADAQLAAEVAQWGGAA